MYVCSLAILILIVTVTVIVMTIIAIPIIVCVFAHRLDGRKQCQVEKESVINANMSRLHFMTHTHMHIVNSTCMNLPLYYELQKEHIR